MKHLNVTELDIISHSANGCTAKQIARLVGLEHRTVESYVANIKKKLGAKNIAHAVYIAYSHSIVSTHSNTLHV